MAKFVSTLPVFASVSTFQPVDKKDTDRRAILSVHGTEVPMVFKGKTAEDVRKMAEDYFHSNFSKSNDVAVVTPKPDMFDHLATVEDYEGTPKVDGRKVSRDWYVHKKHGRKRLSADQVAEYTAKGYKKGHTHGKSSSKYVKKTDKPDHVNGNKGKVVMHHPTTGDCQKVIPALVSTFDREGYKPGLGKRAAKVTEAQTAAQ